MWLYNNKIIRKPEPMIIGDLQYPADIFIKMSEAELNAIGIYTFVQEQKPQQTKYNSIERVIDKESMPPRVSYISTDLSLDYLKKKAYDKIEKHARQLFEQTTSKYHPSEVASWNRLENQAEKFVQTGQVGRMLQKESDVSGIPLADLANEIITNATTYDDTRSTIAGTRHKKKAEVAAMTTLAEIEAYENTPVDTIDEITGEPMVINVDMCTYNWI